MIILKIILPVSLVLLLNLGIFQEACADPPGDDDIEDPDIPLPIDGGLSLLLLAGTVYGLKKVGALQKKEKHS